MAGRIEPLQSAVSATANRISLGRQLIGSVWGVEGEIKKEGLAGLRVVLVGDPLFGAGGPKIGRVAFVERGRDIVRAVVALLAVAAVGRFLWVMVVAFAVADVAEEIVETPFGGIGRPIGGSCAADVVAGETPFAN